MILTAGLLLLGLTFYLSTLAYTIRTFSRSKLSECLRGGDRERWLDWLDEHEWDLQALTSLLRIVANVSWVVTLWLWYHNVLRRPPEASWLTGVEFCAVTLVLLGTFAIGIPHALAIHAGEAVLARSLLVLAGLRIALWPCGRAFDAMEFVVRRLLGKAEVSDDEETEQAEQEILDAVAEGQAHGAVDDDQKDMIEAVIELGETAVSAIMTPRTEVDAAPAEATYDEVREVILRSGHSRIPVYEKSIDHIIGVVYAKDLLRIDPSQPFDARKVMRTAFYVPESKTLDELLTEFRTMKVQIAIVLDEYGGTAGIATIEDILEELVGEIDDEYDEKPPPAINRIDPDTLEIDARVHISEVNEELDIELPEEEDYETVGGFVFATLGKIPAPGEEFQHNNIRVRIVDAEPRKINRLQIHVLRDQPAESA